MARRDLTSDPVAENVAAFREMADLIERSPWLADGIGTEPALTIPVVDPERLSVVLRALGRPVRQTAGTETYATFRCDLSADVFVDVIIERSKIGERRIVERTAVSIPDPNAPRVISERLIVEWTLDPKFVPRDLLAEDVDR